MLCKKDIKFCVILGVILLSILIIPAVVQAALVAQYHLDAGSGTTASDSSGYGNNGTISGASWVQLPSGYCLSFDGINDYVDCGNNSSLNLINTVTMVAWVCPWATQLPNEYGICGRSNTLSDSRYLMSYYNNNSYWFYINEGSNNIYTSAAPGIWNQIAVTFDKNAASQNMKIYVNGVLQGYKNYTTAINSNTLKFYIGACTPSNSHFKGLIDEVNVYNTAFSATEVANLYSSSTRDTYNGMVGYTSGSLVNGVEDGMVAHYNCNEGTGTTLNDTSGFMNTGTLGSSSMWSANSSPNDGYSLSFNGTTSRKVTCGTKNGYDITGPITVMTWINPDSTQNVTDSGLVGKGTSQYMLGYHSNGGNTVRFYVNSSSTYVASSAITAGTWTHVAATYDKSNIKIYINGLYVTQTAYTSAISSSPTTNLMLGCTASAGTNPFKGKMDEVRVYNRALTAAEIGARYTEDSDSRNGMVAHYKLDESTGNKAVDSSGHGNTGTLTGCSRAACNGGYSLHFNGTSDFVDCGNGSSLNITGNTISLAAWVCPDLIQSTPSIDEGIVGKQVDSYMLSLDYGKMWSYINGGSIHAYSSVIPTNSWSYVVSTYDGSNIKIYVNGTLAGTRAYTGTLPSDSTHVMLGRLLFSPTYYYFKGYIDDVRIYNRALSSTEVANLFTTAEQTNRNNTLAATCNPVTAAQSITSGNLTVSVGSHGGMQVNNGSNTYFIWNSSYSYPGTSIGFNALSETAFTGETGWSPSVSKPDSTTLQVSASGTKYSVSRQIKLVTRNGVPCITVWDTITNTSAAVVGTLIDHSIITPSQMTNSVCGLNAASPMIFFSQPEGDFGILAEDDLGRLQYHPSQLGNIADIFHCNFGLDVSPNSYTFKYVIYPLSATGDVFNLVNQVRKDWNSNFTITGPWRFMDVGSGDIPWSNPDDLKKWVQRRNLKAVALVPWLDYDPQSYSYIMSRSQFQSTMQDYAARLYAASPGIKLQGCIETEYVTIDPNNHTDTTQPCFPAIGSSLYPTGDHCWQYWGDIIEDYWNVVRPNETPAFVHNADCGPGKTYTRVVPSAAQLTDAITHSSLIWQDPNSPYEQFNFVDSIWRDAAGNCCVEFCPRNGAKFYALCVYPAYGSTSSPNSAQYNGMYGYLMNQNAFLMDTCGLDGFYQDMFSNDFNAFSECSYQYSNERPQWDGNTVDINTSTGQVQNTKVDISYTAIDERVNMMNSAINRNKFMVANTWSSSSTEQSIPVCRFWETWLTTHPEDLSSGSEPAFDRLMFGGTLGSPIGYGASDWDETGHDEALGLMLCIMKYLRHGMLFYYGDMYREYDSSVGEYGPINHMFPMTPQELHKGWIKGNERIITGVDLNNVSWNNSCVAPLVHFFDMHGREINAISGSRTATVTGTPGNWNISVSISDWSEFCVIEQSDGVVANYNFDEGSGNVVIDSSGNGNTGSIYGGANWISVNGGHCLYFNGVSDYIDCGNSAILNLTDKITMVAWVCPDMYQTYPSIDAGIVGKQFDSYLMSIDYGRIWSYINGGSINTYTSVIPTNSWSQIVSTYDGSNIKIYVDGTLNATRSYSGAITSDSSALTIGRLLLSSNYYYFKGYIDDVKVYNRALSSTEAAALFSSSERTARNAMFVGNGGDMQDSLVAQYKMDEGSGTTLGDSSGFGNTGTITGCSWADVDGGHCLYFDGTNDYVDCGNSPSLNITGNSITMIAWVCPDVQTYPSTDAGIVGKQFDSYMLSLDDGLMWSYIDGGSNHAGSSDEIRTDYWSQVATTYDGSNIKIYVNGTLAGIQAYSGMLPSDSNNVMLGRLLYSSTYYYYKGYLDDISIYNRALSSTEVANMFSSSEQDARNAMFNVAWYEMDEGSGTSLGDSSGFGNTGTISGCTWAAASDGYCLYFDGTNDYVDCGNSSSLNITGDAITLVAWVNPDVQTYPSIDAGIVGKSVDSYLMSIDYGKIWSYINAGSINAYTSVIPVDTWTQIVSTYDGSYIRIYVNGTLNATRAYSGSLPSDTSHVILGRLLFSPTYYYYKGYMDDVRIYSRVLSEDEIADLYNLTNYYARSDYKSTTITDLRNFALGSNIYIKNAPVSAEIFDPTGSYSGFAIEESDRFSGIRVITPTTISAGQLVDVFGSTYIDSGEVVIDARKGEVVPKGTTSPIAPFSIATIDTGGNLKSYQGAVVDNASTSPKVYSRALNNVGIFMRIRGIVTAVGTDFFYVNDGFGSSEILDGSGYKGIKCGKGNLASLPKVDSYVEVTGVVGVRTVNGYNARYMWTTDAKPATVSTYAFFVHAGPTDNTNIISLPAQPVNPDPAVLFNGIDIDNNLLTYDGSTIEKKYTTDSASAFGGINYSYGYAFKCSKSYPFASAYLGYNDPNPLDRWISVPNGESSGSVLIGVPYNHATKWNDWHATDGSCLKSVQDADISSWLDPGGGWYLSGISNLFSPGDALYQNYGYKIRVNKKIAIISPSNSLLDKIITGRVILGNLSENSIVQAGEIPIVIGTNDGIDLFRAVVPTQITPDSGSFYIDVYQDVSGISIKASHWLGKKVDLN